MVAALTFAMAHHIMVDISQILNTPAAAQGRSELLKRTFPPFSVGLMAAAAVVKLVGGRDGHAQPSFSDEPSAELDAFENFRKSFRVRSVEPEAADSDVPKDDVVTVPLGGSGAAAFMARCYSRSSKRTVTLSPSFLPMALRMSDFTGSLCLPSPSAINEL